jgi:hypothetical protein
MRIAMLALVALLAVQADVNGEWEASYGTPLGPQELKMYLKQDGPRISGHTTSEFGEATIRGTISGADVKLSWTETDGGKPLEIAVTAKIDGETMSGTAKLGDHGEGRFHAELTNR